MTQRERMCRTLLTVAMLGGLTVAHSGNVEHGSVENLDEMKFVPVSAMPPCSSSSLRSGDPATGPSIVVAKVATDCTIPWHWHTPNEHLMMVTGTAHIDMKTGGSLTLREGGFARMPSRHVHRFTCLSECVLYVASDGAFDLHYVDAEGQEIPPATAFIAGGRSATDST